ncbi:PLP-dependent transferase, partial [Aureobasidium melanogenum]
MSSTEDPVIDLFQGWPSARLLPISLLEAASQTLLANPSLYTPSLLYGPDPGPDCLLDTLSTFLCKFYQTPWTSPSRLTITGGASQALACILQVYTDPSYTKNVYMVAPTYFLACRIFEDNGFAGRLKAVPEDQEGIDLERLEELLSRDDMENGWLDVRPTKRPLPCQKHFKNIIYCVPTFSNPSGKTMSLRRREQLVRLARKYDALVIADDVYDLLHWGPSRLGKAAVPRLVDVDQTLDGGVISEFGNVVSNGSFSKVLGPGLRTGWTESTELFALGLSKCGSTRSGGSASQFTASMIAEAIRSGAVQDFLEKVLIPAYSHRAAIALDAVQKYLQPQGAVLVSFGDKSESVVPHQPCPAVQGGYYIYLHLPDRLDASEFAEFAEREEKVVVGAGRNFEVVGDEASVPIKHGVRLCFAWEDEHRIVEGIRRVGKALEKAMASAAP